MTDHDQPDPGQAVPEPAWASPSKPLSRVDQLASWVEANRTKFTEAALERSALETGYTKAEFDEAVRLASRREGERQVIKPLKGRARLMVLLGYGLVWLLFGTQFLFGPEPYLSTYQLILTMSLLVAIAISLAWIHVRRPDPDRIGRALAILLAVPVVLLVAVAGLCLPFIPAR